MQISCPFVQGYNSSALEERLASSPGGLGLPKIRKCLPDRRGGTETLPVYIVSTGFVVHIHLSETCKVVTRLKTLPGCKNF